MAWFLNDYKCARCQHSWTDDWSCMCDDDCPHCGARHMSPLASEDLTTLIDKDGGDFVVLYSPKTAEHDPDYREMRRFPTHDAASAFIKSHDFSL